MEEEAQMLLEIPTKMISSYSVAYSIVDNAVRSHHEHWELCRAISDHIAGKKPIDPIKLKKKGLSWASNFNFGKARSEIEKGVSKNLKLITEALWVGIPELRSGTEEDRKNEKTRFLFDHNNKARVASITGYCFARALEEDGGFYDWVNNIESSSYTYGYAPLVWEQNDWKSKSVPITRIAFRPGSTASDVDGWVAFRTEKATDLYKTWVRLRNNSTKQIGPNSSWSLEALEKVLYSLFRAECLGRDVTVESWADVLPYYQQDPSMIIAQTKDLNIAAIYQREVDGSMSEVYIPWGYGKTGSSRTRGNMADDMAVILYDKNHKNADWRDFINVVRDSGFTEDGEIQSMKGIGKNSVENSIRYNRLRNSLTDKSQLVGSPMFEQPSTQQGKEFKITMSQGFSLLPAGYIPVENQPQYDITSQLAIINHEEREFSNIHSHQTKDSLSGLSSRPTKDEVQMASAQANSNQAAKDRIKVKDYACIFERTIKRMASSKLSKSDEGYKAKMKLFKLMKEYLPECETDQDVNNIISMIEGYNVDLVNTEMASLQLAMQLAETPFGRNRVKRLMLISQGFSIQEVNLQVPIISDKFDKFDDERVAVMENTSFVVGQPVVFQGTDDHIIHFETHNAKMQATFNELRQGGDVIKAYDVLINLFVHCDMHIDALLEDPVLKGNAKKYIESQRETKSVISQVAYARNKAIKAQQEAAQLANPGISPKDQHDMRLKEAEAQAQESRNRFKTANRAASMERESQNRHEAKLKEIELEHQRELIKIQNEQQSKISEQG